MYDHESTTMIATIVPQWHCQPHRDENLIGITADSTEFKLVYSSITPVRY